MSANDKDEFKAKYWICSSCASINGWIAPKHGVTVVKGKCGHCKSGLKEFLTPVVDFDTTKRKAINE